MVDPEGGFYFDEPAKEAVRWAVEQIEGKAPEPEVPEAIKDLLVLLKQFVAAMAGGK